ncbi:MAG: S-layer homology domain-containing protein [Oscillospiraceae bacterium]|nr:S-layer homology domain-containing protein [Oscillospiraceae bacterium]
MLKRKLAAICAAAITMSTVSAMSAASVSAVTTSPKTAVSNTAASASTGSQKGEDKAMTAAITEVKTKIKIPDSYSDFKYSVSQNQGMKSYNFTWQHPKIDDGGYSVTLTRDIITRYTVPNSYYNSGKVSIGPYSADDYEKLALDWIYTANPSMKGQLRRKGNVSLGIGSDSVSMSFERVNGNTPVSDSGNSVTVALDKKTGEVRRMHANGWWQGATFESPSKAKTPEAIFKIYSDEIKIKPWYKLSWQNGKKVAAIIYEPTESSPLYNAVTGEHSTMNEDRRKLSNTDLYEDEMMDDADYAVTEAVAGEGAADMAVAVPAYDLSAQEQSAVKELKGMLTSAQFKKLMIADPYIDVTDSYLTDSFNIFESSLAKSGYMINCTFKIDNKSGYCSYRITADAKSGKVYSFYRDGGNESSDIISPAKAAKLGTEAAKYYYGDIFDGYKADTENSAPAKKTYKETERTIRFYRYVNNIQVDGDYISITVNSAGDVIRANFNHTTDVDFGDGKIISKETAMAKLYEQKQPELSYMGFTDPRSAPHTYLTYRMPDWRINAKTGELCGYDGSKLIVQNMAAEVCPYTDIASSPYKSEIETLYNYGIRIFPGEKFDPKANITYKEMDSVFNAMLGYGISTVYYDENGDVYVMEEDIIAEVEDDSDSKVITNRQFVKKFVSKMNAEEYAKMSGIYKSPFSDIAANDPDLGYICIAYGYGAASGVNGKFSPDAPVTREYAMHCVYNFIKKQS